uniref:Uncharacterized protein n=1 Tax=Cacopsylla melanoneura TaxID=428564 RepID=A0A8D9AZT1_9HEMI
MQSLTMLPACICFLSLLIARTTAAPGLPEHLLESNEQDSLTETVYSVQYSVQSKQDIQTKEENQNQYYVKLGGYAVQNGTHNLTIGEKTDQDKLLSYQFFDHPSSDGIVYKNVSYPLDLKINNEFTINYIEAIDQHTELSESGFAWLIYGGLGSKNVFLFLESRRNFGLKYLVRVFGH